MHCAACGVRAWAERPVGPVTVLTTDDLTAEHYDGYVQAKRDQAGPTAWNEMLAALPTYLDTRQPLKLYDVGAGDGEFLGLAQSRYGHEVYGNEVSQGAVDLARERFGISLDFADLADVARDDEFDVVTMWCVLAHVPNPDELLGNCRRILRSGGVMYLQTPHWTGADQVALSTATATRGRVTRLLDRRVAQHHSILHSKRSITAQLERLGFEVLHVQPRPRYSLTSKIYLESLGFPDRLVGPVGRVMDGAVKRGLTPRIVLDVYARKP